MLVSLLAEAGFRPCKHSTSVQCYSFEKAKTATVSGQKVAANSFSVLLPGLLGLLGLLGLFLPNPPVSKLYSLYLALQLVYGSQQVNEGSLYLQKFVNQLAWLAWPTGTAVHCNAQ